MAAAADGEEGEEGEEVMPKEKPSNIGRVLNDGQPLVCGHCGRVEKGGDGQLRGVDVSPQGVRGIPLENEIMKGLSYNVDDLHLT